MPYINTDDTCAIILAAGNSSRMGFDKALLAFDNTQTFIQKIIAAFHYAQLPNIYTVINIKIDNTIINKGIELNATKIINKNLELGRFYSLQLALNNIKSYSYFIIHNIDNPFIDAKIITALYNVRKEADCIIPCHNNKNGHPIIINQKIARQIKSISHLSNLREIIAQYNIKIIQTSEEYISININTPEEYYNYFKCTPSYIY